MDVVFCLFYKRTRASAAIFGSSWPPPTTGEGGLDFLLEAGDQFAVGGDQHILNFMKVQQSQELFEVWMKSKCSPLLYFPFVFLEGLQQLPE
jgi:hypothetical protein